MDLRPRHSSYSTRILALAACQWKWVSVSSWSRIESMNFWQMAFSLSGKTISIKREYQSTSAELRNG